MAQLQLARFLNKKSIASIRCTKYIMCAAMMTLACADSDEEQLRSYNTRLKPPSMSEIINIGPNHLTPNLWSMEQSGTDEEYKVFKCQKDTNVVYRWRISKGEAITTLEDRNAGGTPMSRTIVPKGHVIITGTADEEWSVGIMERFLSKYNVSSTEQGGQHGTCCAKAEAQRRAIKMRYPFNVYLAWDKSHPQRGQPGYYLLQYTQESADYGPVEPAIFDQTYKRIH